MSELLICRACLACRVPVYNILSTEYQNVFERIAVISLNEHGRPHALCAPCLETVHGVCRLQEKSKTSEGILTRLLKQNKLTESCIKAVNRQRYKLADTLPSFTLEPMKPSPDKTKKKSNKIHRTLSRNLISGENLSPCQSLLSSNDRKADKGYQGDAVKSLGTQKLPPSLEVPSDVIVKIEPGSISPEDTRDVVVKIEPGEVQSSVEPGDVTIEPGETQSSGLIDNIAVRTEDMQDYLADVAEPTTSVFTEAPHKQSNNNITIETVKFKETPYIQIDAGKLINNIKTEIDSNNDGLIEIDVEINQEIDTEFGAIKDYNHSTEQFQASSSKAVKVLDFIEKCKKDGRRLKSVASFKWEENVRDKSKPPKTKKETSKSYHCNKCEYQTPFKKRLMYHMKKHVGFVICAICDYKCATKSRLVSHLRVHTKERPYKCKECNKDFTEVGTLTKHMNMHNGVKPYKCMWCDYEAASKNHLDRHIKRHIGDKRFKCELCEYACVQKWDLKRHAKTHENERPNRSYKRVAPVIVKTFSMADN